MIVRNEERFLADCLHSLTGIVDEIVIVDTGSTDASIPIAQAFGATIVESRWQGDFAAARNLALEHCAAEWTLYIDADERLREIDRATIEPALADPRHLAYRIWLRPRPGYTPYREFRLFRNDPRIRFRGVIHESLEPDLRAVAAADGQSIGTLDALLDHVGYEGDQTAKHRRNLPLLREQTRQTPERVFLWWHLGQVLSGLGQEEAAEEAWLEGIAAARRAATTEPADALPYLSLMDSRLSRKADISELIDEASARFPDNLQLAFFRARHLMATGRFAEALPPLRALAAIDPDGLRDEFIAYDRDLFGVSSIEAIAICHFRLGDFAESARWYARAEALAPDRLDIRAKRVVAASRA
jgi:tetratricopeptide (TPR) repeat protein